jgi:WD40 repeat protein
MRFTPDGEEIINTTLSGGLQFLDAETLETITIWEGLHQAAIADFELSEDGTMIVTGAPDGFARVWDLESGDLLAEIQVSETDRVQAVEFVDSDTKIIATLRGGPAFVFAIDSEDVIALGRSRIVRSFTEDECATYDIDPCPTLEEMKTG